MRLALGRDAECLAPQMGGVIESPSESPRATVTTVLEPSSVSAVVGFILRLCSFAFSV
jgi:hypothetical protein